MSSPREEFVDPAQCTAQLAELLQQAVTREADGPGVTIAATSELIGPNAIISSLGLVSFIADAEILLEEEHGLEVTLVSESALSRSRSPFQSISTLVEYIAELEADGAGNAD